MIPSSPSGRSPSSIEPEPGGVQRWRLTNSLSGQPDRRARQLELARTLGLDIDTELPIVRKTTPMRSPAGARGALVIYAFRDTEPSADAPLLLFSHGGRIQARPALASFSFFVLVAALAKAGLPIIPAAVDHRGASCHVAKLGYCLADRVVDLRVAHARLLEHFGGRPRALALMGISMGGHVSAMAAERLGARTLILSCPAAYSERAHFAPLGPSFTAALRRPGSWRQSPAFAAIERHLLGGGSFALRFSRFDQVIPEDLTRRYVALARQAPRSSRVIDSDPDHWSTTAAGTAALVEHLREFVVESARRPAERSEPILGSLSETR
ncbi:alpha/beta fold hydrolase [Paraliomyxa miuraensis]|uniref:alpha/beta fold hydrolase n=1 Tax=Paraliomyxa miuraensis TaxID=376150 RepID=UPI002258854B|nr:alpha/beta fold hydrolase [Paraliomyxa miuraensis]MCX4243088.1 alpha/beta fold hydrolase [Paraliomyxa miuraensis]